MNVAFLSTSSGETRKYADSIQSLGLGQVHFLLYDLTDTPDEPVYQQAKACKPDLLVYIGSLWGRQLSPSTLAKLNSEVAPIVHLCSDAADPPWHQQLREYHLAGAFSLQVAIDGNKNWPLADSQMTLLTPVDPNNFALPMGHAHRGVACGFAGNTGGSGSVRHNILSDLGFRHSVQFRQRTDEPESYAGYCEFLLNTRISINLAYTGTQAAKHVKGRVVESGMAGCCLLEQRGSPTADWFVPGEDYLDYGGANEAAEIIKTMSARPELTELMGMQLRAKVLAEHTPLHFWTKILKRVGVSQ